MRIVVLSDTHGNYPLAIKTIEEAGAVDEIVHLGDESEDACLIEQFIGRQIIKVPGNCDLSSPFPRERLVALGSVKTLITHGDKYQVKSGLSLLQKKAASKGAQLVLYGHSHRAAVETIAGILYVNPGCMIRSSANPSCALVTIDGGKTTAQIIQVEQMP